MPLLTRRRFLWLGATGALGLVGLRLALPRMLRAGPPRPLDGEALEFVERCFAGLDRALVWDSHVHVVGLGAGGTGCWINPRSRSHLRPFRRLQYDVYRSVVGMTDPATADADYVGRLLRLHRLANPRGKLVLMAFDLHVTPDGEEVPERTPFHTPNEYVLRLARDNDDAVACVSIHPYRRDAVERLDAALAAGARAVKWLPNAMGIDPASPRCDAFYRRLAETGLPLITHAGEEYAVHAAADQELGNPLRLRRPLDAGVRVVVAHCAGFGSARDLDAPPDERREMRAFDLFVRLLGERQYERTLYADISALTALNRSGRPLREMLKAGEVHHRLVNGSDWPMPGIGLLFSPWKLVREGYLTPDERRLCRRIHDANPLLFDFVVKRSLRVEENGRVHRFAPAVFETARVFDP